MDLRVGERIKNLSGDTVWVQQKLPRPGPTPVYNLEVQDEHVYYVGANGVLVHNSTGCDAPIGGAGGFRSFRSLKRALGPGGPGKQWHHIVEQSKLGQFGGNAIHNADNVIAIPTSIHRQISGFYSSKQRFTNGLTVRKWLDGQSFKFQREFGMDILRQFGAL